jgi:dGTPase
MAILHRTDLEAREHDIFAPYAMKSDQTRGREVAETPDALRPEFQRDRDRILHSAAFRKLEYKTQVYVTHEGDYFRTRLTHTFEVAQIARTMGRNLGVNSDLTEAIALAHDLGHTPFGHTGEAVLSDLMSDEGGFEHNAQSLRVVEVLEERFHDRPGLNLTWETREGIAKHSKATHQPSVGRYHDGLSPSLEAQIVDLADEIAYNHHDLDDALSMGLIEVSELEPVGWIRDLWEGERAKLPTDVHPRHVKHRALGAIMDAMVHDALNHTSGEIEREGLDSPHAVRALERRVVGFSPTMAKNHAQFRAFLMKEVYRHPTTLRMQAKAARFLRLLFELFHQQPDLLPRVHRDRVPGWGLKRVLCDYLSGMTDRHCLQEYMANFEPDQGMLK